MYLCDTWGSFGLQVVNGSMRLVKVCQETPSIAEGFESIGWKSSKAILSQETEYVASCGSTARRTLQRRGSDGTKNYVENAGVVRSFGSYRVLNQDFAVEAEESGRL